MKKKWFLILILIFSMFLMGCEDILTVVTVNEDGEKVVRSYISIIGNNVYDATINFRNWRYIEELNNDDFTSDQLFQIVNNSQNIVVIGNADAAIEISFFDGGYRYTVYMSADSLSEAFTW